MSILTSPDGLPPKILRHVIGDIFDGFIASFKTNIKPDATIPLLWIIFHKNGLLFCNTHKTRGIYRTIKTEEIDSIRVIQSQLSPPTLQFIFKNLNEDDLFIESPSGTTHGALFGIASKLNIQILQ